MRCNYAELASSTASLASLVMVANFFSAIIDDLTIQLPPQQTIFSKAKYSLMFPVFTPPVGMNFIMP